MGSVSFISIYISLSPSEVEHLVVFMAHWADSSDSSLCVGPLSPLNQPTGFTGVGTNKLVINVSMAMSKHYQGSHPCLVLNSYRVADLSLGNIFLSFASSPVLTVSHKPHRQPGPAPAASGLRSSTPRDCSLQKETEANAPLAPLAPPGGPRPGPSPFSPQGQTGFLCPQDSMDHLWHLIHSSLVCRYSRLPRFLIRLFVHSHTNIC